MSDKEPVFEPYTDVLRQECPRIRILVLGKSGAGKSALINAVFGVNDATVSSQSGSGISSTFTDLQKSVSHEKPGVHDINNALCFPSNDRVAIHDSEGFEAGDETKVKKVLEFINDRSKRPTLADRLHMIWVCAQIPHAGERLFETGVERILEDYRDKVPILVVFTKLDILHGRLEREIEDQEGEDLDDEALDNKVDAAVREKIDKLCVKPLGAITSSLDQQYPYIATSSTSRRFQQTISELVDCALDAIKLPAEDASLTSDHLEQQVPSGATGAPAGDSMAEIVRIGMATAQRSSPKASIDAAIRIGRKRYWTALFSRTLVGYSMTKLLDLLRKDIVNVWNIHDPENILLEPEFVALISILVEDLSGDEKSERYPLTKKAIDAVIGNPTAILVSAPVAGVVAFAEWVKNTYQKTKISLRCMIAFIIDLTLVMSIMWHLIPSSSDSVTISLANKALVMYKAHKGPVHASIRAKTDSWGTFDHIKLAVVIDTMANIMKGYDLKAEKWAKEEVDYNTWITPDELRKQL